MTEGPTDLELRRRQFKAQQSTVQTRRQQAVCVRRAYKRYGTKDHPNVILDGLNMTVPKGCIYGLLGASGCGKTTLLNCIVGRKRLNAGEIWVLGGTPGSRGSGVPGPRIGYMPQEIALYGEFSIRETLIYFGWISNMTTEQVETKLEFLINLLMLPDADRQVKCLSGGQQRRVSLAAALVHDPELLILDEPTVGVDPLLRQNIWNHLVEITKHGRKTVIITTHYIDETRQAHLIGLMRGGYFLAEESPEQLIVQFGADSLEDVFLKLSVIQNMGKRRRSSILQGVTDSIPIPAGAVNDAAILDDEVGEISGEFGDNISTSSRTARRVSIAPDASAEIMPPELPPENEPEAKFTDYLKILKLSHMRALIWKNFLWMWRNIPVMTFIIVKMNAFVERDVLTNRYTSPLNPAEYNSMALSSIKGRSTFSRMKTRQRYPYEGRSTGFWCMVSLLYKGSGHLKESGLPVAQTILFCLSIGHDPKGIAISVVNNEINYPMEQCEYKGGCNSTFLSCNYLDYVVNNYSLSLKYYATEEEARKTVESGNSWAMLVVPHNFSESLKSRIFNGKDTPDSDLATGVIDVFADKSNENIATFLTRDLLFGIENYAKSFIQDCDLNPKVFGRPIKFETPIYGTQDPDFTDFAAPGVILTIIFFMAVALTSGAMLLERNEGILERSLVNGITGTEILFSQVITQFVVMLGQTTMVLIFAFPIFQLTQNGSWFLLFTLTVLSGICGMCFGFVVACTCENERSATYMALGSFLPIVMLCGIIWPIEAMSPYLKWLSNFLPLTQATDSLRCIIARGWGIHVPVVYYGFLSLTVWILIFLTISILVLKFKKG